MAKRVTWYFKTGSTVLHVDPNLKDNDLIVPRCPDLPSMVITWASFHPVATRTCIPKFCKVEKSQKSQDFRQVLITAHAKPHYMLDKLTSIYDC